MDSPSPDSPLGKFNAMTNAQMATFCGSKTLGACVADVMSDQTAHCMAATHYVNAMKNAKKVEAHCLECDTLQDELKALQKKIHDKGCGHILVKVPTQLLKQ